MTQNDPWLSENYSWGEGGNSDLFLNFINFEIFVLGSRRVTGVTKILTPIFWKSTSERGRRKGRSSPSGFYQLTGDLSTSLQGLKQLRQLSYGIPFTRSSHENAFHHHRLGPSEFSRLYLWPLIMDSFSHRIKLLSYYMNVCMITTFTPSYKILKSTLNHSPNFCIPIFIFRKNSIFYSIRSNYNRIQDKIF